MQGKPASCGCLPTGSSTVFIEGVGAVRSGLDCATGLITGGVGCVKVEGWPISVKDDPIASHLKGRHKSGPKTANGSRTVLVGNGAAKSGKNVDLDTLLGGPGGDGVYEVAYAVDPYKPLIDRLNRLRKKYNRRPLSAEEIRTIRGAKGAYLTQLENTISAMEQADLERVKTGHASGFAYMSRVTRSAAILANKYGSPDVPRGALFVGLIDSSFACHRLADYWGMEFPRTVLRGGPPPELGILLEETASRVIGRDAGRGFTKEVVDWLKDDNNVHHHFGEFMTVGFIRGPYVAAEAQERSDSRITNLPDVKSGYFAGQLGAKLAAGLIDPMDASRLMDWAYRENTTAPWSSFASSPQNLLETMRVAYNREHVGNGIPPFSANYPGWQPPEPPFPFR